MRIRHRRVNFFDTLLDRARHLPGVQAAGLISRWFRATATAETTDLRSRSIRLCLSGKGTLRSIAGLDPGYFSAIGIPLLQWADFCR